MENNKFYSVLVNGVIANEGKILISQRSLEEKHQPGKWTIPGGKVENSADKAEVFDIIQLTLKKEIREEVGLEISDNIHLISNNTFQHTQGHIVLALVFLCEYRSGTASALEDTIGTAWISPSELDNYNFAPNVKDYIAKGFALLPYMVRRKPADKNY